MAQGQNEGSGAGAQGKGIQQDTMKPGLSSGEIGGVKNTKGKVDPETTFKAEPLTRRDRE